MRDASTPALLAILLAVTAPAFGAVPAGLLPSSPEAALALVAFLLAAWVGVVVPSLASSSPARAAGAAAVGAPFLVALACASHAGIAVPFIALLAFVALGALATSLPRPWRPRLAIAAACLLAAPPLAASVGADAPTTVSPIPPIASFVPPGEAVDAIDLVPASWRTEDGAASRRPGALARTPTVAGGSQFPLSGAAWSPVPSDARAHLAAGERALLVVGAGPLENPLAGVSIATSPTLPTRALDLDPFDAVLLLAVSDEMEARSADALASFARRGGLLVGPLHPAAWPEALGRRLGAAVAVTDTGPDSARPLGAGRVARAAGPRDMADLLAAGLAVPRAATAFDRALVAPSPPGAFASWRDEPRSRSGVFALLAVFAATVALLGFVGGRRHSVGIATLAILATLGVRAATTAASDVTVRAFALDLGGLGGRRVEGLFLAAGPNGFTVPAGISTEAGARALGFSTRRIGGDMRLVLGPSQVGWLVEESLARGELAGAERSSALPAWAEGLVHWGAGGPGEGGIWVGEAPYGGPRPGGLGEGLDATTVVWTPKRP